MAKARQEAAVKAHAALASQAAAQTAQASVASTVGPAGQRSNKRSYGPAGKKPNKDTAAQQEARELAEYKEALLAKARAAQR